MCQCMNCSNGQMSFSSCKEEISQAEILSYKITCTLLERVVVNTPNPLKSIPAPSDCPIKDKVPEEKNYIKDMIFSSKKE